MYLSKVENWKRHIVLFLFVLFFSITEKAMAGNCIDVVSHAIEKNDVANLTSSIEGNVVLSLPGAQANYSSAQAEMLLSDFFRKMDVKHVTLHRRGETNLVQYAIGEITTTKGNFKLYISVKKTEGQCILKELRIEK